MTAPMSMRWYQEKAVSEVFRLQHEVKRQLIIAATGAGKTIISSEILRRLNKKSLFIAHRDELVRQAASKLLQVWPEADVGIIKGQENEVEKQIISCSVQSLVNRMDQIKETVHLIIIDECHHAVSPTYTKVIDYFLEKNPDLLIVGVTATPDRTDGKELSSVFEQIIFEINMLDLIKEGYLVNLRGQRVDTGVDLSKIKTSYGDFDEAQLSKNFNTPKINELVVETYMNRCEGRLSVAFCCSVQHAIELAATFRAFGISAHHVDGTMKDEERRDILARFAKGEIRVVTNVMVLTEGFDCPEVSCVLMVRPTQSRSLYVQAVGRGMRLFPDKKDCLVIDFAGNTSRHQLVTLLSIIGTTKEQEEVKRAKGITSEDESSGRVNEDIEISTSDIIQQQLIMRAYEAALEEKFQQVETVDLLPKESRFDWNPLPVGYSINLGAGSLCLVPSADIDYPGWNIWAYAKEKDSISCMNLDPFPTLGDAQSKAEELVEKRVKETWMKQLVLKEAIEKKDAVRPEQEEELRRLKLPVPNTMGEAALLLDRFKITEKLLELQIIR
ncbi:DEAD/DEAH box helicase [Brevibacillus centrosporus]|uniref:DEAD/DEAH box helicase n=1 Tax=Brevibacillus centrosporus TaxID=54910 RepID=UPI0011443CE8|nr:DEAD/DEAH box helicase [Brevibacillus centrosporus]MEC2129997.1 DEAD/DEAH box helicase [Brevibacillus centrosporus]GED32375.1 putative DEAD box family helicase, phage associated [Brevibacillus centrosporus]